MIIFNKIILKSPYNYITNYREFDIEEEFDTEYKEERKYLISKRDFLNIYGIRTHLITQKFITNIDPTGISLLNNSSVYLYFNVYNGLKNEFLLTDFILNKNILYKFFKFKNYLFISNFLIFDTNIYQKYSECLKFKYLQNSKQMDFVNINTYNWTLWHNNINIYKLNLLNILNFKLYIYKILKFNLINLKIPFFLNILYKNTFYTNKYTNNYILNDEIDIFDIEPILFHNNIKFYYLLKILFLINKSKIN